MPFRSTLRRAAARAAVVAPIALALGCGDREPSAALVEDAGPPKIAGQDGTDLRRSMSLIDALPLCDVEHQGVVFDLGSGPMPGRFGWDLQPPRGLLSTEHDGATWARAYDRNLTLNFHLSEVTPVAISLKAIGHDSSRVSLLLDGMGLGQLKLARETAKVRSTRFTSRPLDPGLHRLRLKFRGRKKSDADPYAEIDWVRIAVPHDDDGTYGALTRDDLLAPAAQLGGVPHRALGIRAPGAVRCPLRVPPRARLKVAIGMHGAGAAAAALIVRQDGAEPVVLERVDVKGGPAARWTDVEIPLTKYAGKIVGVELAAMSSTGAGRLMFGDPVVTVPASIGAPTPPAKTAVVVVLDGVSRRDLPPWRTTETPHLPTLNRLARSMTVYDDHRGASTLVAASVASMLSGLTPAAHGLTDGGAMLPTTVVTMGDIARDASVRAAMFTGVPTTFAAFGFDTHWDAFTPYPPNGGRLASAPLLDAAAWLNDVPKAEATRPQLAVVHTRGGHPPFDLTPKEAKRLPPEEYAGYLQPRRSAQLIAQQRAKGKSLSEQDEERMRALYFSALSRQDQALGQLIEALEESGRWESTLFIVTGDVASARRAMFADGLPMNEDLLTLPLYVHFPGGLHAGMRVARPTEMQDITRTVLDALRLKAPVDAIGRDLATTASTPERAPHHVRVAMFDTGYSARWGDFALAGTRGKSPRLCKLSIDPTCSVDRTHVYPYTAQAILRGLAHLLARHKKPPARKPVTMDSDTAAQLSVWGAD